MNWEQFHFIRPLWLLALIPVAFFLWQLLRRVFISSAWRNEIDAHLLPHLLKNLPHKQSSLPLVLLAVGWIVAVLALAGPTWSKLPQPVYRTGITRVLILDLSRSMDANDLKPSRLVHAKHKIIDMLGSIKEGQVGLIVYSAEPYVVSPLTEDSATIAAMVPTLSTDLMPVQGSRLGPALQKAGELLAQAGAQQGGIILVTDGVDDPTAFNVAESLRAKGIRLSVLGLGTAGGAPIPLKNGGFLKDDSGGIVISKFDAASLKRLAREGGGQFAPLTADDRDINTLLAATTLNRMNEHAQTTKRTTEAWREQGVWLLLVLVPIATLAFRRGWMMILVLGVLNIVTPHPAYAFGWDDLWLRKDQQATRQLEQNHPDKAAELFKDPQWKGTAYYKAGQYQQAVDAFAKLDNAQANYNRGNALARLGKLQEALEAYKKALKQNPDNQDTSYNKKLIEDLLKKQQNQSQQNQQSQQDKQNKQDKQANQGQQNGQSQSGQSQSDQQQAENNQPNNNQPNNSSQSNSNSNSNAGNSNQNADNNADKNAGDESKESGKKQNSSSANQMADSQENKKQMNNNQKADNTAKGANQSDSNKKGADSQQPQADDKQLADKTAGPQKQPMDKQQGSDKDAAKMATDSQGGKIQDEKTRESMQAMEQWLERIPDDPGGLLREKFRREHQRLQGQQQTGGNSW